VIEEHVVVCDALAFLLGKNCLSAVDAQGRRRLDQPGDYLRTEVATTLREG